MSSQLDQGKRPVHPLLSGPYGHPVHPILVTVPIGAWIASLVFDICSHIADRPGALAEGSQWLIGIGLVGAVAAAMFGLLDLLVIPPHTAAFRTGLVHMTLNLCVAVAFLVNFIWRHGTYLNGQPVGGGQIILSAISVAVLGVSGFLGGMLAYRYGVRVADERTQATGFTTEELVGRA